MLSDPAPADRVPASRAPFDAAQLSVENFAPGFRVVRMSGVLDAGTAPRLARVVATQLDRPGCVGDIVVDLGEVRFFGAHDLAALACVRDRGKRAGVCLHLAGLAGREALLPLNVITELTQFSVFPTVEQAQHQLVDSRAHPGSSS